MSDNNLKQLFDVEKYWNEQVALERQKRQVALEQARAAAKTRIQAAEVEFETKLAEFQTQHSSSSSTAKDELSQDVSRQIAALDQKKVKNTKAVLDHIFETVVKF